MSKVDLITFGCRLNIYESEVMRANAEQAGLDNTIVVNTCAVTAEAERQARQAIRRARRDNPNARIIVTGCSAQIAPERYAGMDEVDLVLGNEEKLRPEMFADLPGEKVVVNDIMSVEETASHLIEGMEGRTRAFVQIQNGCDHRCTFCIIPFGRGNSRSVPLGAIVDQTRRLVKAGFREIVLTGVDITGFGADLPGRPRLGQMMRRLLAQVPELERLRLSSVDPAEIDDDLFRLIENEPRLMPHFHISLQAGDDMILKRMKRRHSRAQVLSFCRKVRDLRPDAVFGADIIAGFPTETDEMFANSLALVEEADLAYLHVFPFSPRPGTPAARMPQVPKELRKQRAARLREAGARQLRAYLSSQVGRTLSVLVEQDDMGRSEGFAPVRLPGATLEPGEIVRAIIEDCDDEKLTGRIAA